MAKDSWALCLWRSCWHGLVARDTQIWSDMDLNGALLVPIKVGKNINTLMSWSILIYFCVFAGFLYVSILISSPLYRASETPESTSGGAHRDRTSGTRQGTQRHHRMTGWPWLRGAVGRTISPCGVQLLKRWVWIGFTMFSSFRKWEQNGPNLRFITIYQNGRMRRMFLQHIYV